ncbi:MAG: hypothetical protein U0164_23985 [Gemmatimonadaceae bacterium]
MDPIVAAIDRRDFVTARRLLEPEASSGNAWAYFNLGVVAQLEADALRGIARRERLVEAYAHYMVASDLGDEDASKALKEIAVTLVNAEKRRGEERATALMARHNTNAKPAPPVTQPERAPTPTPTSAPTQLPSSAPNTDGPETLAKWLRRIGYLDCALGQTRTDQGLQVPVAPISDQEAGTLRQYIAGCWNGVPWPIGMRLIRSGESGIGLVNGWLASPFPEQKTIGVIAVTGTRLGTVNAQLAELAWSLISVEGNDGLRARMIQSVRPEFVSPESVRRMLGFCRSSADRSAEARQRFRDRARTGAGALLTDPWANITGACVDRLVSVQGTVEENKSIIEWYGRLLSMEFRGDVNYRFKWDSAATMFVQRFGAASRPYVDWLIDQVMWNLPNYDFARLLATTHPDYLSAIRASTDPKRIALLAFFGPSGLPPLIDLLHLCTQAVTTDPYLSNRGIAAMCDAAVTGAGYHAPVTSELVEAVKGVSTVRGALLARKAESALRVMEQRSGNR